jgi:DNA adenine methylase
MSAETQGQPLTRPFLKWPGGKFRLVRHLNQQMPEKKIWVEPFVGAGALFLNNPAKNFLLNDINNDLINLYTLLKKDGESFIYDAKKHFISKNNSKKSYYALRDRFNLSSDPKERALLFMFLNRHGFNGLCRFNLKGKYNVPFGHYQKPYFPEKEMLNFLCKVENYKFYNECFSDFFKRLLRSRRLKDMLIYCDPPYAPLSQTTNFTGYAACKFSLLDQQELVEYALKCAHKGANIFISNHDTPFVRELYSDAKIKPLMVSRTISCNANQRKKVGELLAHFAPRA